MKVKIFITLSLICLAIALIPLITAEIGCCYDSGQGICSLNADKNNCINNSGNWSNDATCNAESRCTRGCCIAGNVIVFTTDRRCEVISSAYGVTKNFNSGMTESQCYSQSQTGIDGACVFGEDNNCIITSSSGNCTGTFYQGVSCTDINTTCHTTSNTTCYKEDVYSLDSCGNPDHKTSDCDYASGTICRKEGNTAFCKNLNCADGKNNGQSWCVRIPEIWKGAPVGSRYFRQYCLNGEIFTEPCADFRTETCLSEEITTAVAKCELNDWSSCLAAGNDSAACGELEQCKMWAPGGECVETGSGNIYCGFENKFYKMTGTRDSMTRGEEVTETDIVMDVDSSGGEHFVGGAGELIGDLHLETCVPIVSGGLEFYPNTINNSPSVSSTEVSSATEICAKASYNSTIEFVSQDGCWYFKLDQVEENYFGNAGLLATTKEFWNKNGEETILSGKFDGEGSSKMINPYVYCVKGDNLEEWLDWAKWGGGGVAVIGALGYNPEIVILGLSMVLQAYIIDQVGFLQDLLGDFLKLLGINTRIRENFGVISLVWDKKIKEIPVNPEVIDYLEKRCQAIADCGGKLNWIGTLGAQSNQTGFQGIMNETDNGTYYGVKLSNKVGNEDENGDYILKFAYEFTCAPYKAPVGASDCGKCGSDGFACSKYRCKALGQKCEYYEPEGVETGICQNSDDNEPPSITLSIEPASPIRPNTAVRINALTNERAECKFDMGVAGTSFEGMNYDFVGDYTLNHNVTLNIPGQNSYNESEGYDLINRDGEYDVYARCMDAVGNWNLAPSLISFEVMETPDLLAPILSDFNPASGSRITYGQTSKTISFKINEPAECKWSFDDKNFSEMEKNFSCDTAPSDYGILHGYFCSGTLTNITNDTNSETKFYMRCKDQAWLEGIEDDLYIRNTNEQSVIYVLKPSPELWIKNITPIGELKISGSNMTTTLRVITADGSNNGISECYWSQSQTIESYAKFFNTNSATHTQIVNIHGGENTFYIRCRDLDSNGNEINQVLNSTTFNVIIDTSPPMIILAYINNLTHQLQIVTDEISECKYNNNETTSCLFEFSNGTLMTPAWGMIHSTPYYNKFYYIKCKDQLGFVNTNECGIIVNV